jgi:drug/metabolite transporter (DMT)-like permease
MGAAATAAALAGLPRAQPHWTSSLLPFLLGQALGPTLGAFILWETAMRFGSITFVNSAAYLTPVFSLIASCIVFRQPAGAGLWLGSALVVLGAVLCRLWIREPSPPPAPQRSC